jgi:hypothetical protein
MYIFSWIIHPAFLLQDHFIFYDQYPLSPILISIHIFFIKLLL